jgi:hypothetical protein
MSMAQMLTNALATWEFGEILGLLVRSGFVESR